MKLFRLPFKRYRKWRKRGDLARDSGHWAEAAACYRKHLRSATQDHAIHVQLGHALKEMGDLLSAEAVYEVAANLRPDDADLLLHRGRLACLRGDSGVAFAHFLESAQLCYSAEVAAELRRPEMRPFLLDRAKQSAGVDPERLHGKIGAVRSEKGRLVGWAIDGERPAEPVELGLYLDGQLVRSFSTGVLPEEQNLLAANDFFCGFDEDLLVDPSIVSALEVCRLRDGAQLSGSPVRCDNPGWLTDWLERPRDAACAASDSDPLSIVMPVYGPRLEWLWEAVSSVEAQWDPNWELIIIDDGNPNSEVRSALAEIEQRDERIKLVGMPANSGIATATNAGIAAATGSFVAFLDQDDRLEPDAVGQMRNAWGDEVDLVYSDEVVTEANTGIFASFVARSAFSWDYYLSHPYFVHFVAVRRELAETVGGLDSVQRISADVDFMLRLVERARHVAHVPMILYRWRRHGESTGQARAGEVTAATVKALDAHLGRVMPGAYASASTRFNFYRVDWPDDRGKVAVVIPTRDRVDLLRQSISSVERTTNRDEIHFVIADNESREPETHAYFRELGARATVVSCPGPFNYAAINNRSIAVGAGDARYLLLLNNDVEAIQPGWLEHMRGLCARGDVGAVGATLLYPSGAVQHAGVIVGVGGPAEHSHKFAASREGGTASIGHNGSLLAVRDYSAVTGACMMMPRELFDLVGGFDERLAVGFNDTDLCLRLREHGFAVLNDGQVVLIHHESVSRRSNGLMTHREDADMFCERWHVVLETGDPFYNPLLSRAANRQFQIADLCAGRGRPRCRRGVFGVDTAPDYGESINAGQQ